MIRIVEDDYMDFLYDYFNKQPPYIKIVYPFKNPGFNMSISNFYNNKFLVSIRNVIPFVSLLEKKLNPGQTKIKNFNNLNNENKNLFNESNFDNYSVWTSNNYESTIFFVCYLDLINLKLKVDKNIKPFYFLKSFYSFPLPKELKKIQDWQHYYPLEDFRIFFYNNRCYIYDSFVNQIRTIGLYKNKIFVKKKIENICVYNFNNNYVNKNIISKKDNSDYHKIYEKNWTLYKIVYENKKEKILKFLCDFGIDGLYGIDYYSKFNELKNIYNKGLCKHIKLLSYKKNSIPINKTCRFSIGSPAINIQNNNYLGLGHIKISFKKIKLENNKKKNNNELNKSDELKIEEINNFFYNKAKFIHKQLKKKYGSSYKSHYNYIYAFYIFIYNDVNNTFKISDFYFPLPEYKFKFSLTFPMSIINIKNNYILSAGYGDYTNILMKINKNDLQKMIKYDISEDNFDVTKIEYKFVK